MTPNDTTPEIRPLTPTVDMETQKLTRRSLLFLIVALFAFIVAAVLSFNSFQVGAFTDDATYIVLARSLAEGKGYVLGNFPVPTPESTFPPGYPLILMPLAYVWPESFLPMQFSSIVATLTSIIVFWMISGDRSVIRLNRTAQYIAVLMFALHPWVVSSSNMVMSEAVYTTLTLVTIMALWQLERSVKWRLPLVILLSILLNLIIAVRTVGFSLVIASLLYFCIVKRDIRTTVLLGGAWIVGYLPLFLHNTGTGGAILSTGYAQQTATASTLIEKLTQIGVNLWHHTSANLPYLLVPLPTIPLVGSVTLGVTLIFLMILGTRRLTRKGHLIVLYLVSYAGGVLLFWNPIVGSAQTRFLLPILPFLALMTVAGWEETLSLADLRQDRRLTASWLKGITVFLIVAITLLYVGRNVQAVLNPIRDKMIDLTIGTAWISENAPNNAIVACQDPVPMSLYTNTYTVSYPTTNPEETFMDWLLGGNADYLIIAPRLAQSISIETDITANAAAQTVLSFPNQFRLVFQDVSASVMVYEIIESEDITNLSE